MKRKEFANEVKQQYQECKFGIDPIDQEYLIEAMAWFICNVGEYGKISAEEIGVVKVLKLALKMKHQNIDISNYEAIRPIYEEVRCMK